MKRARLRTLSTLVGWVLYLAAGLGLWLNWGDLGVWLLTEAAMLAIQWSQGFSRPKSIRAKEAPDSPKKVLRWHPSWW